MFFNNLANSKSERQEFKKVQTCQSYRYKDNFQFSFIKSGKLCIFAKQIYQVKLLNFKSYVKWGSNYLLTIMLKIKTCSSYIQSWSRLKYTQQSQYITKLVNLIHATTRKHYLKSSENRKTVTKLEKRVKKYYTATSLKFARCFACSNAFFAESHLNNLIATWAIRGLGTLDMLLTREASLAAGSTNLRGFVLVDIIDREELTRRMSKKIKIQLITNY